MKPTGGHYERMMLHKNAVCYLYNYAILPMDGILQEGTNAVINFSMYLYKSASVVVMG